jgi:hypothetical protein
MGEISFFLKQFEEQNVFGESLNRFDEVVFEVKVAISGVFLDADEEGFELGVVFFELFEQGH